MLGIQALVEHRYPDKPVVLTVDGMIARAENRSMVELLKIPLVPIGERGDGARDGHHHGRHAAAHAGGGRARPTRLIW